MPEQVKTSIQETTSLTGVLLRAYWLILAHGATAIIALVMLAQNKQQSVALNALLLFIFVRVIEKSVILSSFKSNSNIAFIFQVVVWLNILIQILLLFRILDVDLLQG